MADTEQRELNTEKQNAAGGTEQSASNEAHHGGESIVLPLLGILAAAVLVRALIYFRVENVLHAEEAIQGLMARHILKGELQLFTYGLPYLGTLQAHWIALCTLVGGSSTAVLKWAAALDSLLLVMANYLLAREIAGGDRRVGLLAAILTAVGPLYLIEWSLRPRGGHLEAATFSALAIFALLRAIRAANDPDSKGTGMLWLAGCGLLLGVGLWVQLTVVYALAACLIGLLFYGGRLRTRGTAWLAFVGPFVVGGLPLWLFNVRYPGRTIQFLMEGLRTGGLASDPAGRIFDLMTVTFPVLMGSRQTMASESIGRLFVMLSWAGYLIALGAAALAISAAARRHKAKTEGATEAAPNGAGLLFLFAFMGGLVFLLGPFRHQASDPAVLLPLYAAVPPLAAFGIVYWWSRKGLARILAGAAIAAILLTNVAGYRSARRDIVQPTIQGIPVPNDLSTIRAFFASENIGYVYTNFLIGYRLAFESNESIIPCTDRYYGPERHVPYLDVVKAAKSPVGFVVDPRMAEWLRADLTVRGIKFEETEIDRFWVFHGLSARYDGFPPGPGLCLPAEIDVGDYPNKCRPGKAFSVDVTVTNRSKVTWPASPSWREVLLSYHIVSPESGEVVDFENARVRLKQAVAPGESVNATLSIFAPETEGRYAFVPDLVIEGVEWFSRIDPTMVEKDNQHEFVVAE